MMVREEDQRRSAAGAARREEGGCWRRDGLGLSENAGIDFRARQHPYNGFNPHNVCMYCSRLRNPLALPMNQYL
eukprot:2663863-Rhodomonas_salina.1